MAKLIYKTRGNSSPEGKTQIYFTCNPNDFDTYFVPICEEILSAQDCAIYFKEDPASGWNGQTDMENALGDMQLFVVPVTRRFFSSDDPSVARYYELPFAGEHNILLLGIIEEEESNLTYIFNEIYKNYKNHILLDRFAKGDDFEKPSYEESLSLILSYFESPIYMSQNYERQINKQYKENYERLTRLVEIYEQTNNWALVKETYKNLLSVAKDWIEESNGNINEMILVEPYLGLGNSNFLLGNLQEAQAMTRNAFEIINKFQDGEDTPRFNRLRAYACKNLGDICLAKNDYKGASEWFEMGVSELEALPKETCTLEDFQKLSGLYTNLGDIYIEEKNSDFAYLNYSNALKIIEKICNEKPNDLKSLRDLSVMNEKMGNFYSMIRRLDLAKTYYQESLRVSLMVYSIVAESGKGNVAWVNAIYDLSFGYYFIGLTCEMEGDLEEAVENFYRCLELRKEAYHYNRNFKQELYDCYTELIKVLREAGHFEEAEKCYEEVMNLG